MKSKCKWLIGGLGAFGILLLIGGAIALQQIPNVSDQLPPNGVPLSVTLGSPLNGTTVPLDSFTTITAQATGAQPIASLELWVDGAPLPAKSAPQASAQKQFSAFWTWTPSNEGAHLLFVRGTDATQQIATSNVVRVLATKEANVAENVNYKIEQGDTVEAVAKKFNTVAQAIVDLNPASSLGAGQTISVPVASAPSPEPSSPQPPLEGATIPEPPNGSAQTAPSGPPNKAIFWINQNLLGSIFKPALPPAPVLAQKVEGCSVKLFITDYANNEDGFFIYRADTGSQSFKRIATLDAFNGTAPFVYVDSNVYGPLAYYVATFNIVGESPSKYVQPEISDTKCASPNWTSVNLNKGKLIVKQSVDKVYCYLSVNAGPWSRVPAAPNAFLFPTNAEFDVSQYINTLPAVPQSPITLVLECWGWSGNTLVYLGEATETINPSVQPIDFKLSSPLFELVGDLGATQVMSGGLGPPPNGFIVSPFQLQATTNPTECNAHGIDTNSLPGQLASITDWCAEKIKGNELVLIWGWPSIYACKQGSCPQTLKDIEGYHVYGFGVQKDGQQVSRTLLGIITPASNKVFTIKTFPGVCYAVRAFAYGLESADSNVFCPTGQETGTETVKLHLQPPPTGKAEKNNIYCEQEFIDFTLDTMGLLDVYDLGPDEIGVGFIWTKGVGDCPEKLGTYQGAIRFDLAPIMNRSILNATLSYWNTYSSFGAGSIAQGGWSCAQYLSLGKSGWKDTNISNDLVPFDPYLTLPTKKGGYPPIHTQDVTEAVRSWADASRPNGGFIFNGIPPFGPPSKGYGNYCLSYYSNFELLVTVGK